MPLLRYEFQFFTETDPTTNLIMILVLIGAVLLTVVVGKLTSQRSGGGARSLSGLGTFSFRRSARKIGLTRHYIRLLEGLVKKYRVSNPERVLHNSPVLDNILRREMAEIEESRLPDAEKDLRKHHLFLIKQVIEANSPRRGTLGSTRHLKPGEEVKLYLPHSRRLYLSEVAENTPTYLGIRAPLDEQGKLVKLPPGSRVHLSFVRYGTQLFSAPATVRHVSTRSSIPILYIDHLSRVPQVLKRRHKRIEFNAPTYFYKVQIVEGTGRRREAVVNTGQRYNGTIIDLSAGGCGVRTYYPLPPGSLLRLDFRTDLGEPISAYGKVRGVTTERGKGTIMHVMFTSMSRHHLNELREIIYDMRPGLSISPPGY
ncbi:PilZ domain-containing protein [Spirochaeta thermophila]|uniref:Type IV pilus assembly PilZ n=1 Tax=Winmispira thermophila (strain ATCC 49972 / DSM 6192 / RI 19.B1) TaxID=665571 RepID=E0RRT3_WINT6|nr:PilZ domain-containing protein [Spirochaeta thermophila]ADN01720.1 hypothetical protein STHERM_c07690 [Spirochaeta thermophila DSM 6192]